MFDNFDDIPCTNCPHRKDNYCKFYKELLDEVSPEVYIPCMQCEDEFDFSMHGP